MHVLRYFELELSAGSGSSRFRFPQLPRPFKGFGNDTEDNTHEFEDLHVSEDTAVFDPASTTTTSAGQLSNHRSPRAATSHHDDGLLGDPPPAVFIASSSRHAGGHGGSFESERIS